MYGPKKSAVGVGNGPGGGGGATQSGKRYQLRSDLLGAVAFASRHG